MIYPPWRLPVEEDGNHAIEIIPRGQEAWGLDVFDSWTNPLRGKMEGFMDVYSPVSKHHKEKTKTQEYQRHKDSL